MTTEQDMTMVFKDAAGEYYLVPLATVQRGQVPAEQRAEVERLIAESEDVQGYIGPLVGAFVAGFVYGFGITGAYLQGGKVKAEAPDLSGIPTSPEEPAAPFRVPQQQGRPA